jgi:hypothetical protein
MTYGHLSKTKVHITMNFADLMASMDPILSIQFYISSFLFVNLLLTYENVP